MIFKLSPRNFRITKNFFGVLAVMLFYFNQQVYSQQEKDSSNCAAIQSLLKITVSWYIGPEWEKKISRTSSISLFAGPEIGALTDGFSLEILSGKWGIVPNAFAEYRNYYNFCKRSIEKKKIQNNAANFVFGRVESIFPVKRQNYVQNYFNLLFVEGWGGQRNLWKHISIDYHLGVVEHFYYDKPPSGGFNYILLEPLARFSVSYLF